MPKHILLVDADELLRRSLADQLSGQGFVVSEANSKEQALSRLRVQSVDGVLVDAGLADDSAVQLCLALRDGHGPMPVVVLGPLPNQSAAWLEAGACQCVAKPYRFAALLERLQRLMRDPIPDAAVEIGDYHFHPVARLLTDRQGRQIRLTEKEAAILAYLRNAGDRPVSREELLGEVWGYADGVSSHTVETHIYRLRRKIGDGDNPVLRTEIGGYRLGQSRGEAP